MATSFNGAGSDGYAADDSADAIWGTRFSELRCVPPNLETGDCRTVGQWWDLELTKLQQANPEFTELPDYKVRWKKARERANSPWRGIFEGNLGRVQTSNVFSTNDQLLELAVTPGSLEPWQDSQRLQKPCLVTLDRRCSESDRYGLEWALVQPMTIDSAYLNLWAQSADTPDVRSKLVREWAELSFWFSPVSGPAGWQKVKVIPRFVDMTEVGGTGGFLDYDSHSYIVRGGLSKLFQKFTELKMILIEQ